MIMYTPEEQFLYQTKNIYDQLLKYKKIYPIIFPIINNTKLEKSLKRASISNKTVVGDNRMVVFVKDLKNETFSCLIL